MICKKCGKLVDDNATFCPECGSITRPNATSYYQSNGMAVAGFVCSFLSPLLGWIFGGIGLSRSKYRNGTGKGFSIAAIIIATIMFILNIVIVSKYL